MCATDDFGAIWNLGSIAVQLGNRNTSLRNIEAIWMTFFKAGSSACGSGRG